MSDQTKLEFAEWLKVRDTVETILSDNVLHPNSKIAEELMAAGIIDVAAILGYEPESDDVEEVWSPTHDWRTLGPVHAEPVVLKRKIGRNYALVETQTGNVEKAMVDDLYELGS